MSKLAPPLQQIDRTYALYRGRRLIYFGGCDYFRLASHPRVLRALADGLKQFGLNVAASRRTTGNHALYEQLERELARFFGVEAAVLLSNGYVTNLAVAQALAGECSHGLLDERAHGSLRDAAVMFGCPIVPFQHHSPTELAGAVRRLGNASRPIVLTDGMFSADGSIAPLREYLRVLPKDGLLLVDDAHAAGVIGRRGRGTAEHCGVRDRRIIQTITLSKAFGVYGGAVLASRRLARKIIEQSRLFTGNTPVPLPLANAALAAVQVLATDRTLRRRLVENTEYVKSRLGDVRGGSAPGPILAVTSATAKGAALLRRRLLNAEIYPPFIQYPGGPENGFFRFAISSEHTRAQLERLVRAIGI